MAKKIVLLGAGGLGREVANIIEGINRREEKYELLGFLDDYSTADSIVGYPRLGGSDWILEHKDEVVCTCTIGDAEAKARVQSELMKQGVRFESIIAPTATVAKRVEIGAGCILYWHVGISIDCKLGAGVLLNDSVIIGHDTTIGDYTSIMTRSTISGNCQIGEKVDIGGHVFVIPGKKIGDGARVAAGSIVFSNVRAGATVLGNPAKRMKELE